MLAEARGQAGLDQTRASKALGISQTAFSKLENGLRSLEVFELVELCELYGVDPCEIILASQDDRSRKPGRK